MSLRRREFLFDSVAWAAASAGWGGRFHWDFEGGAPVDKVLVIVQLTGGNDGLNTVVPLDDDRYHKSRPRLRVAKGSAVKLNDLLGLHPSLEALRPSWDRGELAIVNSVGYPNPDRSHFRSMDIWHTARTDVNTDQVGWIGRASDLLGIQNGAAPALHVGSTEQPLSLVAERLVNPSIVDLDRARLRSHDRAKDHRRALRELCALDRAGTARWIANEAASAYEFSARVEEVLSTFKPAVPYPNSGLAKKLRTIDQLLGAGSPLRAVQVELDGFDTHASQADPHSNLLRELADALAAFLANLRSQRIDKRVVVLVFSEFGRRVRENASGGTDHGAAAPLFVLGANVKGGVHGDPPDLGNLDEGDVPMGVDFRRVYATVLAGWLGVDPTTVLGGDFAPLPLL